MNIDFRLCECGLLVPKDEPCDHPAHEIDLRAGYWVVDPTSGRPYKTGTMNRAVLRKRMDEGGIYFTRKAAQEAARELPIRPQRRPPDGGGASNP